MLLDFHKLGAWKWALSAICGLMTLFLLLPIMFIVALSFGNSRWLIFPPPGWTLRWYEELFADPRWIGAALTSAKIAFIVMVLSVILGLLVSLALVSAGRACAGERPTLVPWSALSGVCVRGRTR